MQTIVHRANDRLRMDHIDATIEIPQILLQLQPSLHSPDCLLYILATRSRLGSGMHYASAHYDGVQYASAHYDGVLCSLSGMHYDSAHYDGAHYASAHYDGVHYADAHYDGAHCSLSGISSESSDSSSESESELSDETSAASPVSCLA